MLRLGCPDAPGDTRYSRRIVPGVDYNTRIDRFVAADNARLIGEPALPGVDVGEHSAEYIRYIHCVSSRLISRVCDVLAFLGRCKLGAPGAQSPQ